MDPYIKWLENKIEVCLEDKDLQKEHWAFCQALIEYRKQSKPLYSDIETAIIKWSNDGTKTAGTLTREIMEIFNGHQ